MIRREELYARRCVEDLVLVIEQVPVRAAARAPMTLDHVTIRWVALWTLLRWERTFLPVGLEQRGIDLDSFARDLDELIKSRRIADAALVGPAAQSGPPRSFPERDVEQVLLRLLDQAATESQALGHHYLGTEHLLLALIAGADDELSALLGRYAITHRSVREFVAERIPPMPPEEPGARPVGESGASRRIGGPGLASWDTEAVGVPRRFGMAIMLLIMAMYAVLFATMTLLDANPTVFVMIAVLFTGVGLGQMLLFGGRYPRAASVWVGACLLPVETLGAMIYWADNLIGYGGTGVFLGQVTVLTLFSIPIGALLGYLAGGLTAGVFLLLERYAKRRQPVPDVEVWDADAPAEDAPGPPVT
jgi:hypothetical protein